MREIRVGGEERTFTLYVSVLLELFYTGLFYSMHCYVKSFLIKKWLFSIELVKHQLYLKAVFFKVWLPDHLIQNHLEF